MKTKIFKFILAGCVVLFLLGFYVQAQPIVREYNPAMGVSDCLGTKYSEQTAFMFCSDTNGGLLIEHQNNGSGRIVFVGEPIPSNASPWFPQGAEWYYGLFNEGVEGKTGCVHMTIEKDTLFAGKMCKQLKLSSCVGDFATLYEYVYPCGDSLFYYNYDAKDFFLLLNLSAKAGDTIWVHRTSFIPNPGFDPYYRWQVVNTPYMQFMAYKILDVDMVEMSGKQLKRQKVEPIDRRMVNGKMEFSGWRFVSDDNRLDIKCVIEGIGSSGGFWGETSFKTPESGYYKLRCFSAGDQTYMTDGRCDNVVVEPTWVLNSAQWQLSPQPAGEVVQVVCTSSDAMWQKGRWFLHDLSGRRLQSGEFTDGRFEVSLRSVPQGMYMIETRAAQGGAVCRLKCVKGL